VSFVYIVQCRDLTLYIGMTDDVQARVKRHNAGRGAKYTRARLPVELVYFEEVPDRRTAMQRERALKKLSRKQKMELVNDFRGRSYGYSGLAPRQLA
jgi:putative endonuclease